MQPEIPSLGLQANSLTIIIVYRKLNKAKTKDALFAVP